MVEEDEMVVAELMRKNVSTMNVRGTLADAIEAMLGADVSALPVIDAHGKPVGIVTNREILAATLEREPREGGVRSPNLSPVAEFMAAWPPAVEPETALIDAARMMSYLDVKRVFVADGDRLVGVLSQTDIVDALATARHG